MSSNGGPPAAGAAGRAGAADSSSSGRAAGAVKYRSDATRPSRSSLTAGTAPGALPGSGSALARQPSGGGSSRRSSVGGAAGGAGALPRSSALAQQGVPAAAGPPGGSSSSSTAAASGRQPGPASAAGGGPVTPLGGGSMSHVAGALHLQSNALFNQESSMTPSVRKHDYTPTLSPELQHLEAQQRPQAAGSGRAGGVPPRPLPAAAKAGQHYLPTTGDLFHAPDQDSVQEPLVVDVSGTRLVSPGWNQARPWLTGDWLMQRPVEFISEAGGSGSPEAPVIPATADLDALGGAEAEALLVDDLLSVLMGQAGQFIKQEMVEGPKWQRLGLRVTGVADASLVEQVERLLPLCECVFVIKRFVETRSRIEYPTVVQAVAAAMRRLQEEWWLLVVQLEHQMLLGQLSLAGLAYYCQAPAASLSLLASIAGDAADQPHLTSAGLLNLLAERQRSLAGDRAGQRLVGQLLEAAAEPYFAILRQWLVWGVLDDPYCEFMVKEDAAVGPESLTPEGEPAYWSLRYRLRGAVGGRGGPLDAHDVPEFLVSSKEAILVTGKYLNVIRLCGQPVPPAPDATLEALRYDAAAAERGAQPFLAGIQAALAAAAGGLLAHMRGPDGRLLSWLHCLKHFYLLDQGDLLVHLLELAEADGGGRIACLPHHQLQGLLEAALRSSSVAASPHVDVVGEGVLRLAADRRSILQLVTAATCGDAGGVRSGGGADALRPTAGAGAAGFDGLTVVLQLSWPLNLLASKRQLLHYQALSKQLLSLKCAERQLGRVWQAMRATKRLEREDQARFRPWHLLASRLQHIVGEVLRFTTIDVLEPLWGDMAARLAQAGNMDEVIALHNAFLSAALERSLLTQVDVVRHIHALLGAAQELAKEAEALDAATPAGGGAGGLSAPSSSRGMRSSGGGSGGGAPPAASCVDSRRTMALFCRDANRQAQLAKLQALVSNELQALVLRLDMHYKQLLSAAPAAAVAAAGDAAGGGVSAWRWGGAGGMGDSSRELASLHNLLQRLQSGCSRLRVGGELDGAMAAVVL